ncbi:MAG: major facilitator superfamily 1 [Herbinix sp.]|nr:major facilitator superfamily 1 [Herbinix sp.]
MESDKIVEQRWKKRFATIVAGQTISLIGSSAVQFSLIWWLASKTASPIMMSLAGLFAFLPQLLLGPFAGVWIDRLKRKTVIICADMFIGLVAALFALSFLLWAPPYWMVCVVLGVRAIANVFHTPAIQAVVPMLVPSNDLMKANGWSQFLQAGAFMLGPVIGAAMYAAFSMPVILLTDLLGAIVASISIAIVHIPEIERKQKISSRFTQELKEGIAVYMQDRKLSFVTLIVAVSLVFFMPLSSMYPLMTSDYFKGTAWQASIIQITYSLGMMLGAGMMSQFKFKNKLFVALIGMIVLGVTTFVCGVLPASNLGFWIFAVVCLAMGASVNIYNIPYMSYMQENIPREAQGRAFSLVGSLMSLTMPLGLLVAGPVAEFYGVPFWFTIAGLLILAITMVGMIFYRKV